MRGSETLGLAPKSYATVVAVDSEQNEISVKKADGQIATYDPSRVKGVSIYEPEMRGFAEGDRLQFTAPWRDKAISNRDLGTVTYLDDNGNIRVSLDGADRRVGWNLNDNKHLDYAYAMTSGSAGLAFRGSRADPILFTSVVFFVEADLPAIALAYQRGVAIL